MSSCVMLLHSPDRSVCAKACGGRESSHKKARKVQERSLLDLLCLFVATSFVTNNTASLSRGGRRRLAWRRTKLCAVRLELELRTCVIGFSQVLRIIDNSDNQQPIVAIRMSRQPVNIFRDGSSLAVWHAVLAEISFAKIRCHYFKRATLQNSTRGRRATAQSCASAACIRWPRTLSTCTLSERWSFKVRNR